MTPPRRHVACARAHSVLLAAMLLATLVLSSRVYADSLGEAFRRGNQAYAQGRTSDAIAAYERIVGAGVEDPDVSYNLALAYGTQGQYGQAIRYFERSLRLAPGDPVVEKALADTRTALGERTAQLTGEAIVAERPPLWDALFSRLTTDSLAWGWLVGTWLACLCGLLLLRLHSEAHRLGLGIAAGIASLVCILCGIGLGNRLDWGQSEARAVVVVQAAALREGPDANAPLKTELSEGTLARILSRDGSYVRVQAGHAEGFLLAQEVGEI